MHGHRISALEKEMVWTGKGATGFFFFLWTSDFSVGEGSEGTDWQMVITAGKAEKRAKKESTERSLERGEVEGGLDERLSELWMAGWRGGWQGGRRELLGGREIRLQGDGDAR